MGWIEEKAKRIIGGRELKPYEARRELAHKFRINRSEAGKILRKLRG